MDSERAGKYITDLLKAKLPPHLTYHAYLHTIDVTEQAMTLAAEEGVTDERDLALLKTAAYYHDSGYLYTYDGHEEEGCRIASEVLPGFGYSQQDIDAVCRLIMQTKVATQNPQTLLEKILCDADLDYLGRDDFEEVSSGLFKELKAVGKVQSEKQWDEMQVNFLQAHHYFTASAATKRDRRKHQFLEKLKKKAVIEQG